MSTLTAHSSTELPLATLPESHKLHLNASGGRVAVLPIMPSGNVVLHFPEDARDWQAPQGDWSQERDAVQTAAKVLLESTGYEVPLSHLIWLGQVPATTGVDASEAIECFAAVLGPIPMQDSSAVSPSAGDAYEFTVDSLRDRFAQGAITFGEPRVAQLLDMWAAMYPRLELMPSGLNLLAISQSVFSGLQPDGPRGTSVNFINVLRAHKVELLALGAYIAERDFVFELNVQWFPLDPAGKRIREILKLAFPPQ